MSDLMDVMYRQSDVAMRAARKTRSYQMAMSISAGARLHGPKIDKALIRGEWIEPTKRYSTNNLDTSVFRKGVRR